MGSSSSAPIQPENKLKKHKKSKIKVNFLCQPRHIQKLILQKLSINNIANLARCCKTTAQLVDFLKPHPILEAFAVGFRSTTASPRVCIKSESANKESIRYDHKLKWLQETKHVRVCPKRIIIEPELDDDLCQRVIDGLGNIQASILSLQGRTVTCQPELLSQLIEMTQVTGLHCHRGIDWLYMQLDAIKKLDRLVIFDHRVYNETLLSLRATILYLNAENITVHGLNRFLAEWQRGERVIKILRIFNQVDGVHSLMTSPLDLKAKIAWTSRYHRKLGNLRHWKWSRPWIVYKIKRTIDNTVLFVALREKQVKVVASNYLKKYKELCFESTNM